MSLDTHKYGYALKGTLVVLYRNRALRQSQYFCYADWTGGMYTTPTIAGSRSGGLIAQCKLLFVLSLLRSRKVFVLFIGSHLWYYVHSCILILILTHLFALILQAGRL